MRRARQLGLVVAALSLGEAACLVQISHVADPRPIFSAARVEAERLTGRPGRARELNVLVWNRDDGELVRVSLPIWIVRKAERRIDWRGRDWDGESNGGLGGAERPPAQRAREGFTPERAKDHARNALRRVRLEDIEKAGLGILAEVEEDGGDQVLVWLR
jgi:hypothetical protein